MIVSSGITEVVYEDDYSVNSGGKALLKEAGVKCRRYKRRKPR
jgi:deoxycytidylate deaminase